MNELKELKLIDVKKEAEYIEDLIDKSFNHTLKEK